MSQDYECPFCEIVGGEAAASVVAETDETLAFVDLNPATEGHTLVIPKEHAAGLEGLDPAVGGRLFEEGMAIAAAAREALDPDGINFFLADGVAAGQEVFHVHLHVVPRYEGDDVQFVAEQSRADREELDAVADRLRGAR
ncbi:HIT family protein [Haloglomus litoreum]|uniref:HIT family protein n=1 Tax=Haloglomus litoreum TaxID=3034026 RepID=UPI0023E7C411|nr:HIT family protein [Haloglomus sp. DT116]